MCDAYSQRLRTLVWVFWVAAPETQGCKTLPEHTFSRVKYQFN
jgi:hypothetical protein